MAVDFQGVKVVNTAVCVRMRTCAAECTSLRQSVLVKTRIIVFELLAVSLKGMFLTSD